MTTPKELADLLREALADYTDRYVLGAADATAEAAIDQLQAMAEARQGSREPVEEVIAAAQAVIDRWDSPLWKDVAPTAEYIGRLRAAVEKHKAERIAPPSAQQVPPGFALVPLRMTVAMQRVFNEEGWEWRDVLAAAESITEEQYNAECEDTNAATIERLSQELRTIPQQQATGSGQVLTGQFLRKLSSELAPCVGASEEAVAAWWKHYAASVRNALAAATQAQPAQADEVTDDAIDNATQHLYFNGRPVSREYRVGIVRAVERLKERAERIQRRTEELHERLHMPLEEAEELARKEAQ